MIQKLINSNLSSFHLTSEQITNPDSDEVKECPGCHIPISSKLGCLLNVCLSCIYDFCRSCLGAFSDGNKKHTTLVLFFHITSELSSELKIEDDVMLLIPINFMMQRTVFSFFAICNCIVPIYFENFMQYLKLFKIK